MKHVLKSNLDFLGLVVGSTCAASHAYLNQVLQHETKLTKRDETNTVITTVTQQTAETTDTKAAWLRSSVGLNSVEMLHSTYEQFCGLEMSPRTNLVNVQ